MQPCNEDFIYNNSKPIIDLRARYMRPEVNSNRFEMSGNFIISFHMTSGEVKPTSVKVARSEIKLGRIIKVNN